MTQLEKEIRDAITETNYGPPAETLSNFARAAALVAKRWIERAYMVSALNESAGEHDGDGGLIKGKNQFLKESGITEMNSEKPKFEITIDGGVIADVDANTFCTEFMEWIESKGWSFGGGIGPYTEENDSRPPMGDKETEDNLVRG